jgi:hypothetical protein
VYWYRAYGQLLAAEIALPELRPASPGIPAWTVHWGGLQSRSTRTTGVVVGRQHLYQDFYASLFDTPSGYRIVVEDTGEFQLSPDGREITAWRYEDGHEDFLRAHLLGRVIATSMHFQGVMVLHGSAVSYPRGAVAFLAPKGTGKSTMALNLTMNGGRLLSDDALPVQVTEAPMVWPGIHSIRLTSESAGRLAELPSEQRPDGKYVLSDLGDDRLEENPCPIQAIYLLAAAERIAAGSAVERRRLPAPLAAAALVGQSKIPEMLGPEQGPELLRRAVQVASRVPIYQLPVVRDLDRLQEVAGQIRAWHADVP